MFLQLSPGETFPIKYQISTPDDLATTYYPQAVIYNSRSGAILATIPLVAVSGQAGAYAANWQVPADTSNVGYYIDIQLTVWTDANHTTRSLNYQVQDQTYLVQQRALNPFPGGGPGSGFDIDYKRIGKILKGMLDAMPKQRMPDLSKIEQILDSMSFNVSNHGEEVGGMFAEHYGKISTAFAGISKMLSGVDKKLISQEMIDSIDKTTKQIDVFSKTIKKTFEEATNKNQQFNSDNYQTLVTLIQTMDGAYKQRIEDLREEFVEAVRDEISKIEPVIIHKQEAKKRENKDSDMAMRLAGGDI